jgi:RimJ/RimL family protein N-acetyltransferase
LIREGTAEDVPAIGRAMADAFHDDPVVSWYWRKPDRRPEHLAGWFSLIARIHYLPHGKVFVSEDGGDISGCSMWARPGHWRFSAHDEFRAARYAIPHLGLRLPLASIAMRRMESKHPESPHWYLSTLGVRSAGQGRGLGSRLMFEILSHCDQEQVPAYLESSSEGSRALYERHGFETVEVLDLPRKGPPLWLMWRTPKSTEAARAP